MVAVKRYWRVTRLPCAAVLVAVGVYMHFSTGAAGGSSGVSGGSGASGSDVIEEK